MCTPIMVVYNVTLWACITDVPPCTQTSNSVKPLTMAQINHSLAAYLNSTNSWDNRTRIKQDGQKMVVYQNSTNKSLIDLF